MKNLIWFNRINTRFNCGSVEKYELMRQFYGEKVVLREAFENVSDDIVNKVTKALNRQIKGQEAILEI